MISSLPWRWCITLPFFPFPGLFSFPMTSTVLQCPMLGQSSCWLDNFWRSCACIRASIFSTQAVWLLLSVACAVCSLRRRLLFPYLLCILSPHQLICGQRLWLPPSLSMHKERLFICLFVSTITISNFSKLRVGVSLIPGAPLLRWHKWRSRLGICLAPSW